jgi:hypothetical protein
MAEEPIFSAALLAAASLMSMMATLAPSRANVSGARDQRYLAFKAIHVSSLSYVNLFHPPLVWRGASFSCPFPL